MRRFLLLFTAAIIAVTCLPLSALAAGSLDKDADPVPVVSSGSFTCDTWIHTSMDSFSVGGGELSGADWSFSRGYVGYNLTGTFTPGETLSLSIAGTMGEMGYQMQHKGNDLSFYVKYFDESGRELKDLTRAKAFEKSSDASMTDEISAETLDYVKKIELHGSFTCKWSTPYSAASETVAVKVVLESKSEPVPIPSTTEPKPEAPSSPSPPPSQVPSPTLEKSTTVYPPLDDPQWDEWANAPSIVKFGDLHGEVNVKRYGEDDDAYIFAELDTPLYHGCVIKTLRRSGAILSFSDMSTYVIKEDAIIILDIENIKESKVLLVAGNVWTNLKSMMKDGSLNVEMSQAVAGIKGTTLICEENDGVSTVKVLEGTVEVTAKATGKSVMVSGGEMLSTDSTGKGTLTMFDMEAELAGWEPYVQQVTVGAMEEADRKSGGFPVVIMAVAAILLAVGAVVIVLIARRNKRKAMPAPPYAASVQAEQGRSPRFCPNCGNPLGEIGKFCGKCGQRLQ